ncbi:E3 ubiquitin-protein ligase synoviolin [Angomonas deanei]|uniref:Zinc finger, C3HC4 type (RING finger)/Ring finger domain/RING-like zinc finger/RING-type zinc-finger containing protein, putative n=1 Tax=Angomonas deanei TaxID=59799 RepID=A0A7G2CSL0_9TRYP|nr:E3 ubiquitin-protein ligase synoviolin [Angomonas deanei]CAD2221974.1 Zinc finger, C3HC4 type (RING finger)/Ring finger domain/RING-like zinc finger/RING-type zinc-finger containing protein, putative [Angomonas deanei]|eukprot:EPY26755.1 E3 ubiquitin-protein ligase synoviolin [Angomonas deanei]
MVSRETLQAPASSYTVVSFLAVSLYVLDYVNTYGEVYTTVIALRSSSIFSLLAVNTTIAFFVGLWYFNTAIFFGALTPTERGAIAPAFPVYLAECIGIPLYLDQNMFSMKAGFMLFTVVLRVLHKLADERIITTSALPNGSRRTYMVIRVALFLLLSLSVDILVFCTCWIILGNNSRESEAMFTYCVLLLYGQFILSTFRYGLKLIYQQVADDRDNRSPMVFYAEKALEILHSFVFVGMFLLAYYHLGQFPFILLRNFFGHCYLISENCKNVYRYVVLSWRVDRLPNAAEEDLTPDVTCTICYEEMKFEEHPKVLPCGHTYHKNCLSRWFEGHATCPYCRADLLKAKIPPRQPVAPPPCRWRRAASPMIPRCHASRRMS